MALGPMVAMIGAFAAGVADPPTRYPLDGAEARKAVWQQWQAEGATHASIQPSIRRKHLSLSCSSS
jgi:hypothetical protein